MSCPLNWQNNLNNSDIAIQSPCLPDLHEPFFLFQGELQLNSTANSVFKPADAFPVPEYEVKSEDNTQSVGSVVSCNLKTISKCINCNKSVDSEKTSAIVRCHHCSSKQKILPSHITKTLSLQLQTQTTLNKFVIFNDVLNSFLAEHNLQNLNNDEIENYILSLDRVTLTHNISSDVVLKLDIYKEDA